MVENESYDYKEELNDDFQSPCSSIQWTCMVLHTSLAKKSSSHHSSLDQGVGIISRTSLSRLLGRWCLPRHTSWTTPYQHQDAWPHHLLISETFRPNKFFLILTTTL